MNSRLPHSTLGMTPVPQPASCEPGALEAEVAAARDAFGIEHLIYHWVNAPGGQLCHGTYPEAWKDRYMAAHYEKVDPVVQACRRRYAGLDWKELDWCRRNLRRFLAESAEYGLGNQGYSIPLHGPAGEFAIISANHSCDDAEWAGLVERLADPMLILGRRLHERARQVDRNAAWRDLTPRELGAMTLLARGRSRAQAARELKISEHTLRDHIESARIKLDSANTTHAVAIAAATGLVTP
jgi:DNA-binding CsgD family transcriptional regulator